MNDFQAISKQFKSIDVYQILRDVLFQKDIQDFIRNAAKNRIQKTGIDAFGNRLETDRSSSGEAYSFLTNILKENKSGIAGITDHVTLTDTGKFWKSVELAIHKKSFVIDADFRDIYDNFTRDYGSAKEFENAILSLNKGEFNLLAEMIYPRFIKHFNEIL